MNEFIQLRDSLIKSKYSSFAARVARAIEDYSMITGQKCILVGVSGGKDSLSLFHVLDYLRRQNTFSASLLLCNIDLGYHCTKREQLLRHFQNYGAEYCIRENNILVDTPRENIGCFWCSWNRRKALFKTAREFNCSTIALGHHMDDIVHTALMNLFYYGQISTSAPKVDLFKGEISLIRPLCYIKEEETQLLAQDLDYPISCCSCPQKSSSKRTFIKQLFKTPFEQNASLRENIYSAFKKVVG